MPEVSHVRALIFDVDGTLYRQGPLRRRMLARLAGAALRNPMDGVKTFKALQAYRRAQEVLRKRPAEVQNLEDAQRTLASQWSNSSVEEVGNTVARWMEREPLDVLSTCRYPGVTEVLEEARRRGMGLAVVSDYPARQKLEALGLSEFFNHVVCAQDREVQQFKPHARGLEIAMAKLGVSPREAMYIGDRPDVDAVCAERARMSCAILGAHRAPEDRSNWIPVRTYRELANFLWFDTVDRPAPAWKGMQIHE